VRFDLDGSGRQLAWSWITPQAAWLVYDPQGQGQIDSAIWLFGPRTFQLFCADGFAALALLDDDGDGHLAGSELTDLALWRDADRDGVSDPGEVRPLQAWGIVGLSCQSEPHRSGIRWAPGGVRFADGSQRPCYDLVLERHDCGSSCEPHAVTTGFPDGALRWWHGEGALATLGRDRP
jgi:hypothetical protein